MTICKKTMVKLFKEEFNGKVGFDFAGRKMICEHYGIDCPTGWNADHILPRSKGGSNKPENIAFTNIRTNNMKGNRITWWDDDKKYQVQKKKNTNQHVVVCLKGERKHGSL